MFVFLDQKLVVTDCLDMCSMYPSPYLAFISNWRYRNSTEMLKKKQLKYKAISKYFQMCKLLVK